MTMRINKINPWDVTRWVLSDRSDPSSLLNRPIWNIAFAAGAPGSSGTGSEPDEPDLQFRPTDTGYRLEIPMPGVRPEWVAASVGTTMVITTTGIGDVQTQVFEIPVPDDLDPDTIEAEMAHGLFVATATRRNRMRQIPVKTSA